MKKELNPNFGFILVNRYEMQTQILKAVITLVNKVFKWEFIGYFRGLKSSKKFEERLLG